jgi:gas vesicle protein
VNERTAIATGATVGALVGAVVTYLFFTDRGRDLRQRMEPAVDGLRDEFMRFKGTLEKVGDMATEGLRVVQEFNTARTQSQFPSERTSH